jgi:hypothetical protein
LNHQRDRRDGRGVVTDATFYRGTQKYFCFEGSHAMLSRHNGKSRFEKGKAVGSEEGKVLGSGHCYECRKEAEQRLNCV